MQGNLNLYKVPFQQMRLIPIRAPSSSPLSFPSVYFGISSRRAVRIGKEQGYSDYLICGKTTARYWLIELSARNK